MSARRALAAALLALAPLVVAGRASAGEADPAERLAQAVAPAVVPLRGVAVVSATLNGQELFPAQEEDSETRGVVVDPSGLLVVGVELHMIRALEAKMPGLSVSVDIRRIEVQLPGETKDRPAVLVARDATYGLAFVQVLDLGEQKLAAVDLADAPEPAVGATLWGVSRLRRGFDHAVKVERTHVIGAVEQPRRALLLDGDVSDHGTFLFDAAGRAVGMYAVQLGAEGVEPGDEGDGSGRAIVLSPAVLRAATEAARKKVPEAVAKAKEAKPEPATAGDGAPAPDAPKAPAPDAPKEPAPAR
ncbi:MAG: hypothetical protein IT460_13140 [Planctomycetes bacterium]|nr:hypothetical protein [Planctomycetota bacterium]